MSFSLFAPSPTVTATKLYAFRNQLGSFPSHALPLLLLLANKHKEQQITLRRGTQNTGCDLASPRKWQATNKMDKFANDSITYLRSCNQWLTGHNACWETGKAGGVRLPGVVRATSARYRTLSARIESSQNSNTFLGLSCCSPYNSEASHGCRCLRFHCWQIFFSLSPFSLCV